MSERKTHREDEYGSRSEQLTPEEIKDMKREDALLEKMLGEDDDRKSFVRIERTRPSRGERSDKKGRFTNREGKPRW